MKKFLIFAILVSVFSALSAQRVNSVSNSIELSVGGGVQALHFIQEEPFKGVGDEISPVVQFGVTYHFSPIIGARLAVQGGNTLSSLGDTLLPNLLIYTHGDLLINLTNFWQSKAKKKYYDLTIVFGSGFISLRPEETQEQFSTFAINGGLLNTFYLTRNLLLNLELKLGVIDDLFPVGYYHQTYGGWMMNYDATLGLSYRIPVNPENRHYSGGRR